MSSAGPPADRASSQSRARRLGVATRYEDAGGVERSVAEATLASVCDLIAAPGAFSDERVAPLDDVVVVRGGRIVSGLNGTGGEKLLCELTLEDGSVLAPTADSELTEFVAGVPPQELPLGIHTLRWRVAGQRERETTVVVAPARFPPLARARPGSAVFVPTYAVWSTVNAFPGYRALFGVADAVRDQGVDCIATLPLFAPGLGSRFDASPYSPVSRFHLNEIYAVHDAGGAGSRDVGGAGATPDPGGFLDWSRVATEAVADLNRRAGGLDPRSASELEQFLDSRPDVVSYAAFCATADVPQHLYELGQWLAERSLDAVVADLHDRGISLALDLPVGSRPDEWEHARWPGLFVEGATIGAPPDAFFAGGQDWGLPPLNPLAARRDGHRMWHDLLANAARHADVLRIDHVMQVLRLWWVPVGSGATEGTYVSYPAEELLAVASLVAERTDTVMVGEDLGTVPPEMVSLMDDWGLPGMHEELFALHDLSHHDADVPANGGAAPSIELPEVPTGSWAGLRTHDMAPVAKVATEVDTEPYRGALQAELGREVGPGTNSLAVAMIERLAASNAGEVVIDLHDALGSEVSHNVPGTVGPENWSHRLPVSVEDLTAQPSVQHAFGALRHSSAARQETAGQPTASESRVPPEKRTGDR